MRLNLAITLALVILFASPYLLAQSASELGISLSGKSEFCTADERENPELSCYKVRMVFQNNGNEPVIIFNPTLGFGTGLKEILYQYDYSYLDAGFKFHRNRDPVNRPVILKKAEVENFKAMANFFGGDQPPENMTVIVAPGDNFTFVEKFEIEREYRELPTVEYMRVNPLTGKKEKEILDWKHKEYPESYKLIYEFSFLPYIADPDFLDKLSIRWKKYGRLPVGTNGSYTITSEVIK